MCKKETAVIRKNKFKILGVFITTVIVLAGCGFLSIYTLRKYSSNLDLEEFTKKIQEYSMVERVVFIEENKLDFINTMNMEILLKDGGYIGINNVTVKLECHNAFFTKIGTYHFHKDYYDTNLKQTVKGNLVSVRFTEKFLGISLRSLRNVLENYYIILLSVENQE
jgi:hypothetical protein